MTLYMEVTKDKFELPVRVCNSRRELAMLANTSPDSISQLIYKYEKLGQRTRFRKVEVDDDND